MRFKSTALVAAIAAASWCAAPSVFAQAEQSPPTSADQDMSESMPPSQRTMPDDSATSGAPTSGADGTSNSSAAAGAQPGAPDAMSTGAPIDQTKVEQFADAYIKVQTIQQKANTELETATDPAKADQVKTTAQSEMIAAVEQTGLQIEEFNHIVASMAADTDLRSRVSAEVQKRVGGAADSGGSPNGGT